MVPPQRVQPPQRTTAPQRSVVAQRPARTFDLIFILLPSTFAHVAHYSADIRRILLVEPPGLAARLSRTLMQWAGGPA
jgi:hypothetical protein